MPVPLMRNSVRQLIRSRNGSTGLYRDNGADLSVSAMALPRTKCTETGRSKVTLRPYSLVQVAILDRTSEALCVGGMGLQRQRALNPPAQGCEGRATLGRRPTPWANPTVESIGPEGITLQGWCGFFEGLGPRSAARNLGLMMERRGRSAQLSRFRRRSGKATACRFMP